VNPSSAACNIVTKLSVNVNKVAMLRNTRHLEIPGVLHTARIALDAGAAGITVHPRPDQRHIRSRDVDDLAGLLEETTYINREFNVEGNPFLGEYVSLIKKVRPDQCTLVPDDPGAFTSDQGWDVAANRNRLQDLVAELHAFGCRVSLFMDPDRKQIDQVPETGADRIELYTEPYAAAYGTDRQPAMLSQFIQAADTARQLGLGVNAGHDLNRHNLGHFVAIPGILEVSIGHALIADAIEFGLARTVAAYLEILEANA